MLWATLSVKSRHQTCYNSIEDGVRISGVWAFTSEVKELNGEKDEKVDVLGGSYNGCFSDSVGLVLVLTRLIHAWARDIDPLQRLDLGFWPFSGRNIQYKGFLGARQLLCACRQNLKETKGQCWAVVWYWARCLETQPWNSRSQGAAKATLVWKRYVRVWVGESKQKDRLV